ncbi:hypothetical protein [Cupriavidus sp. SK-4]|uniref:hypothetical protein n=1 Tax=Cupriavidus sp. SK-4 TaxID=574750 RepID=UPI00126841C4|nr:hypothetical protein [Cupriavidus sp. SK-4]
MSTAAQEPTLLFFRKRPHGWDTSTSIASSLQSIETSFFLTALGRYPHALLVCVSAIESCLQAASIGPNEKDGLQDLIKKARRSSAEVNDFPEASLERLRSARNRIVHHGFSPHDDSESVSIYLEVGIPFLDLCYKQFHSFDLMDGLLIEYAEHVRAAQKVHTLAQGAHNIDLSYCVHGFSHSIRWSFKESFSSSWEIDALAHAEEIGTKFDRTFSEKKKLENLFEVPWSVSCPVCREIDAAVVEIDPDKMDEHEIATNRLACTNCGFVVHSDEPYLSQVLLEGQVSSSKSKILEEYGPA